jgi:TatD DNase family protein
MFIDSHCHLLHTFTPEELESFFKGQEKLRYIIEISTNFEEFFTFRNMEFPDRIYNAFGLYPETASCFDKEIERRFREAIAQYPVVAIGEVGLDYYWDYGTPYEQEVLFRNQLEIADELSLPVIVHSRSAFDDTYRILKSCQIKRPVIMHCFGYGAEQIEAFLAEKYYISFAGNVTFKNAFDLQDALKLAPLEQILLETDSPYLTPVPMRGRKNRPEFVEHVYNFVAQFKETDLNKLVEIIENNFNSIFLR